MTLATRPKSPAYHKKRMGKHHAHNKQYLKSYWPYIPLLAIVGLGLFVNNLLSNPAKVLGDSSDFSQSALLLATNTERIAAKQAPLNLNQSLITAAQAKASDMVAQDYWSHDSPSGKKPWTFITGAGYRYQAAGENLAYGFGTGSEVVRAWMSSAEHKANLLNARFQEIGFGVAISSDFQGKGPQIVVVALYASPGNVSHALVTDRADASTTTPKLQPVSRLQLLPVGTSLWSVALVSLLTGGAIVWLVIRHGRAWHKALLKGEAFVLKHVWLDILIVLVATVGVILTRVAGKIG